MSPGELKWDMLLPETCDNELEKDTEDNFLSVNLDPLFKHKKNKWGMLHDCHDYTVVISLDWVGRDVSSQSWSPFLWVGVWVSPSESFLPLGVPVAGWMSSSSADSSCLNIEGSLPQAVFYRRSSQDSAYSPFGCFKVFRVCPKQRIAPRKFLYHRKIKHFFPTPAVGGQEKQEVKHLERPLVGHSDLIWVWQPGPVSWSIFFWVHGSPLCWDVVDGGIVTAMKINYQHFKVEERESQTWINMFKVTQEEEVKLGQKSEPLAQMSKFFIMMWTAEGESWWWL